MTTRAERERLIARDDGSPEDTVYLAAGGNTGTRKHYHDDPEACRFVYADTETDGHPRRWCHRRGYPPCRYCVLGERNCTDGGDRSALEALKAAARANAE